MQGWTRLRSRRFGSSGRAAGQPRVLIIVQNLPVPFDRRVWQECLALRTAGYGVSVICPRAMGAPRRRVLEGVHIYGFRTSAATGSALSYLREFANGWTRTAALSLWILLREGFDVVQTCNPPDTMFPLGRFYRALGIRFVYDQHDLCPEVFLCRFTGDGPVVRVLLRALYALERATYRVADHVIVTNNSYRKRALTRGGLALERVTTVRNCPDESRLKLVAPDATLRGGRPHLACYLGIMGPQDGVDLLLDAIAHFVHDLGRTDCQFALLGFGDCLNALRRRAEELRLSHYVSFTGRADDPMIRAYLSTADVGLSADPFSPLNDISTMNKTVEYMAFGLPVLAYELTETRVSAGDAAVYVTPNDHREYAAALADLLDDPARRATMGRIGRRRIEGSLAWRHQAAAYIGVFDRLLGRTAAGTARRPTIIDLTAVAPPRPPAEPGAPPPADSRAVGA